MNLDDFKADWIQQRNELAGNRFDELVSGVVARATKLEASIRRRDWIEAAAAAFVVAFLSVTLLPASAPIIMKIGAVIIMLGAIEIVVVLFWTRHRNEQLKHDLPLIEFCSAEIRRVDRQIQLLRSVNWWYSGPLMFGCCVMIYGMISSITELPAFVHYGFLAALCSCVLAVMYIVYRINARAVEKELVPIRDEFAELMRSLEQGDSESSDT